MMLGFGRRDGDGADGACRLIVEERDPGGAVVGGAPDAAVVEADIEDVGLAGNARKRAGAAGARGPDLTPVHLGIEFGVERLGRGEGCECSYRKAGKNKTPEARQVQSGLS